MHVSYPPPKSIFPPAPAPLIITLEPGISTSHGPPRKPTHLLFLFLSKKIKLFFEFLFFPPLSFLLPNPVKVKHTNNQKWKTIKVSVSISTSPASGRLSNRVLFFCVFPPLFSSEREGRYGIGFVWMGSRIIESMDAF